MENSCNIPFNFVKGSSLCIELVDYLSSNAVRYVLSNDIKTMI